MITTAGPTVEIATLTTRDTSKAPEASSLGHKFLGKGGGSLKHRLPPDWSRTYRHPEAPGALESMVTCAASKPCQGSRIVHFALSGCSVKPIANYLWAHYRGGENMRNVRGQSFGIAVGIAIVLVVMTGGTLAVDVEIKWAREIGTSGGEEFGGLTLDSSGVYVGGSTPGTLPNQSSAGSRDAFVRKLDGDGNTMWTRQFGSSGADALAAVSAGSGAVYAAGYTTGGLNGSNAGGQDVFLQKFDTGGTPLWTRQFGTSGNDYGVSVTMDASGVYVAGTTAGSLPGQSSAGLVDGFVRKYDHAGADQWTRQFGVADYDGANGVSADSSGVYVAGNYGGSGAAVDAYIRKYDASGTFQWHDTFGTSDQDIARAVSVGPSGLYVVGYTRGSLSGFTNAGGPDDAFVRRYDTSGPPTALWTHQFGTSVNDQANAVFSEAAGVYVAGNSAGTLPNQTSAGGNDAFIRKYDASGSEVWLLQFGTASSDGGYGVAADSSAVYVSGETSGTLLGQTNAGGNDIYAVKIGPKILDVDIDIKPGSDPNCFNNDGKGVIPVAILGSGTFDATKIDPSSVQLADLTVKMVGKKSPQYLAHTTDVNNDTILDMVVQFADVDGAFSSGSGTADLVGKLLDGTAFQGTDSICVV